MRLFAAIAVIILACAVIYIYWDKPLLVARPKGHVLVQERTAPEPAGHWTVQSFYSDDTLLQRLTDSVYNSLSNKERVAQLIMPGTSLKKNTGLPFTKIMRLYKKGLIGGVVFLKGTKSEFASEIRQLNKIAKNTQSLPLIFSCDCEPTLFHKKFTDASPLPATSSLKDHAQVQKVVDDIASQIKAMGIHWNLAPVVDLSMNKEIIDARSFGSKKEQVISQSIAFIRQSTLKNIAATVKHFPGHGSVKGDSHYKLVYADSSLPELPNFKEVIEAAQPVSVMVGHIAVPRNSRYATNGLPASLSRNVVTGLLKGNMKFNGIIITDAMNMGAVKHFADADFRAIEAGNDVVLMPLDVPALHARILLQMKKASPLKDQLVASIKKVIRLKICMRVIRLK